MMGERTDKHTLGYLPQSMIATGLMMAVPIGVISVLLSSETVTSVPALIAVAVGASLVTSRAGAALWKRRPGGGELLFGELMLWGWLRRLWSERRLAEAEGTLRGADLAGGLDPAERAERLLRLSTALEASDPYTHGHSRRVARHSATIAKHLRLLPEQVAQIRTAAAVHDVGKINTPPGVLGKTGSLTEEEFALVKRHAADGAKMVAALEDTELTRSVLHHHERLDGTGYPAGLAGEEIPIGARIIAVADTFDAITSARPYRRARTHREALGVLAGESGSRLDPTAVHAFLSRYSDSRPLAAWTVLISGPERLVGVFGGGVNAASTAVASVAVAAVAALAPAIAGPDDARDPTLAAGPAHQAALVPQSSVDRSPTSHSNEMRPPKSERSSSSAPSGAVTADGRTTPAPDTGGPPIPQSSRADSVAAAPAEPSAPVTAPPDAGGGTPDGGAEPIRDDPEPAPPANDAPSPGEPDGGIHLLPHLPVGPHLPHLPGSEG